MTQPDVIFRTSELRQVSALVEKVAEAELEGNPSTWRSFCATEIFAKFSRHAQTARRLLPDDSYEVFDVSALAALARIVIECREALLYFTQRGISEKEHNFRIALYQYHSASETSEIIRRLELPSRPRGAMVVILKRDLCKEPFFKELSPKEQKLLLSGRKAYYWRGSKPKPIFVSEETESALFKLLSNHVHSFPLGATGRFGGGGNIVGNLHTAFFAIEALTVYSASTLLEFTGFRWKLGRILSNDEKRFLKRIRSDKHLEKWLSSVREEQSDLS